MKFDNALILTLLVAGLAGCGSGSSHPDAGAAPRTLQRMAPGAAAVTVTVNIAGYRDDYTIVRNLSTNAVTVTNKLDQSAATYPNPGLIKFVDKWTSFETDGAAGRVYRLYQAAFNRTPDLAGLGFWVHAHEADAALADIAKGFVVSDEFKSLYGQAPSPLQLVSTYYRNVLHRDGEKAGVDWWVAQMDNGADAAGVLLGFSESAENKDGLAAGIQNGFDYTPYNQGGPIVPKASSYENKIAAAMVVGTQVLPAEVGAGNAVAYADFFQDGSYSMVTHTLVYDPAKPASSGDVGAVRFYKMVSGRWVDHTSDLLQNPAGCLHPRKALVADFNRDGKPDVFFACHGFDAPPFPGEQPVLLLSQADGRYQLSKLPFTGFIHSAAAADVNGDGYPDILVTDNMVAGTPYFLINHRDGSFTQDMSRLPSALRGQPIFTAELISFQNNSRYDVFLAGHEQDPALSAPATIFPDDGAGRYLSTTPVVMPSAAGFGFVTDVVLVNNAIYLARTIDAPSNFYGGAAIQKISYPALGSQMLFQSTVPFPKAGNWEWGRSWINWIIPYQSTIVTMDKAYNLSLPQ